MFLVLDRTTAEITMAKHKTACIVVGSTRHAEYAALDTAGIRQSARNRIAVSEAPVIGWFGQALHHLPRYAKSIAAWSRAVGAFSVTAEVVYKPHTRESEEQRQATF